MFSYDIKSVTNETHLYNMLSFVNEIFKDRLELTPLEFSKETWLARMTSSADFMLYAQHGDEIVGVVFGIVESNNSITVGMVATDERYWHHGIASSLFTELEKQVLARGHHLIVLGALEAAESKS